MVVQLFTVVDTLATNMKRGRPQAHDRARKKQTIEEAHFHSTNPSDIDYVMHMLLGRYLLFVVVAV